MPIASLTDIKVGDVIYSTKYAVPFFIGKRVNRYFYNEDFSASHPRNLELFDEDDHRRAIEVRVPIIILETYGDYYYEGGKIYRAVAPWGTVGYIVLSLGRLEGQHSFTIEKA